MEPSCAPATDLSSTLLQQQRSDVLASPSTDSIDVHIADFVNNPHADDRRTDLTAEGDDDDDDDAASGIFSHADFVSTLDLPALFASGQTSDPVTNSPHDRWVALKISASAFCLYFAVLLIKSAAFAATFKGQTAFGMPLKAALALAQTCGYLLGKPIALFIVPKIKREQLLALALYVVCGEGLTVAIGSHFGPVSTALGLFLGGLFGAPAWGMLVRFAEGRARTDAIIAVVSFCNIGMGGVAKSIGSFALSKGLSDFDMVSASALLGIALGTLSALALAAQEPPSMADIALRGERRALNSLHEQGIRLLRRHGLGILFAVCAYVLIGTLKAYRDFFQAELFDAVGVGGQPGLFAASELSIAICVLCATSALSLITNSWLALNLIVITAVAGALLVVLSSAAHALGLIGGFAWIYTVGVGAFFAYIPVGTIMYERLLAAAHEQLTSSLLSILSDASVLVGTGSLLISQVVRTGKVVGHGAHASHAPVDPDEGARTRLYFTTITLVAGSAVAVLMVLAGVAFNNSIRRTRRRTIRYDNMNPLLLTPGGSRPLASESIAHTRTSASRASRASVPDRLALPPGDARGSG
jgi:hypothetical protein